MPRVVAFQLFSSFFSHLAEPDRFQTSRNVACQTARGGIKHVQPNRFPRKERHRPTGMTESGGTFSAAMYRVLQYFFVYDILLQ